MNSMVFGKDFSVPLTFYFQNGGDRLLENKDQYGKTAVHCAAATCNVDVSCVSPAHKSPNSGHPPLQFLAPCFGS